MLNENPKSRTLDIVAQKLAYFPVPKVASSSMKQMFHELEFGEKLGRKSEPDHRQGIHTAFFNTRDFYGLDLAFYQGFSRIAIIRDPVERILSAYTNRVEHLGELSEDNIDMDLAKALNVEPDPPRHKFFQNIDKYRILSESVRHHTDPFTRFLGPDLGYYTDVYKMDQLDRLAEQISGLCGKKVSIEHYNKRTGRAAFKWLGVKARKHLLTFCAGDYALLGGYFSPPKL